MIQEINNLKSVAHQSSGSTQQVICGGMAGIFSVVAGYPFDVVKTRIQRYPRFYQGMFKSAISIGRAEGLRSFYHGVSLPLAGAAFSEALQFTVLRRMKIFMQKVTGQHERLSNSNLILSAVLTGFLNSFVLSPVELIKI